MYDVSVSDHLQYIVMEYVDGITLKEYLKQRGGALTWKETVHFATQILSALQHAHSKGIIHRDVKPQNIMLLADGSIKMMDFGIARFSRAQSQTVSDKAIGSVHYISPEQASGAFTDARSRYQFYNLGRLWSDMEAARAADVKLLHLCTPPVSAAEVYTAVTGKADWHNELPKPPFDYDLRSRHAALLGGSGDYLCTKQQELDDITRFMRSWRD